jgi:hypothetical protein
MRIVLKIPSSTEKLLGELTVEDCQMLHSILDDLQRSKNLWEPSFSCQVKTCHIGKHYAVILNERSHLAVYWELDPVEYIQTLSHITMTLRIARYR